MSEFVSSAVWMQVQYFTQYVTMTSWYGIYFIIAYSWTNIQVAGDLRRHDGQVIVMVCFREHGHMESRAHGTWCRFLTKSTELQNLEY